MKGIQLTVDMFLMTNGDWLVLLTALMTATGFLAVAIVRIYTVGKKQRDLDREENFNLKMNTQMDQQKHANELLMSNLSMFVEQTVENKQDIKKLDDIVQDHDKRIFKLEE